MLAARADYAYCLRATAVYGHLSYGKGGKLRRQYHYRAAEVGRDVRILRERIAARVRGREEDQAELVAAVRAGAITVGERGPAAREPDDDLLHSVAGTPVLILGAR